MTLPATVQSVNAEAFCGCMGLTSLSLLSSKPLIMRLPSAQRAERQKHGCGDKEYAYGTEMTLTATPAWEHHLDYHFVKWTNATGDSLSGDSSYTFKVTGFETLLGVRNVHSISYNNSTSRYRQSGF
ncbi:hypothetical protein Barb6XT_02652 [Bacteroidales bacterium Barb6XT]|nr:hypothetical protein Barb6XT_02652 [Bacteroidales bacterium Barb6XT]